ncbi:acyltransferase family protein [uncultured Tateyamaria sp.]|uniref:acyltransferase family protein n=1 Tax=uncultured Tateyamaria sp. TaxID=455651 RepID=UPI0026071EA9|nr:acyltransferase family protein [uncultured Tateyamaria sp.]
MKYRAEIDGLRAIAVAPVILFHAGFSIFSGGFVGVDVFFVISGYLITTILITDIDAGRFSLMQFYERRARRILPALFVVLAVSAAIAWVTLMPKDMLDFSESLAATALFSSNILFWKEAGYFDTAAELKPLLHTWSLAVEEQFYIFFPPALYVLWRWGRRNMLGVLIAVFVLSLALAQWGAYHKPSSAFYLLPTRAWELLMGSFCAFYLQRGRIPLPAALHQGAAALGLGCISFAVFAYDTTTPWPGLYALLPTLGTALIILFATRGTLVHHLLSFKWIVGLGLISYSAYLWHQPLFVFARYRNLTPLSEGTMLALCAVTIGLAWLSWRYIEAPFRAPRQIGRAAVFRLSATGMAACILVGAAGYHSDGFKGPRIPDQVAALAAFTHDDNPFRARCFSGPNHYVEPDNACILGNRDDIRGVLMGDSHSDAVAYPLHTVLDAQNVGLKHMWYNGCPPIEGLHVLTHKNDYRCAGFNADAFAAVYADPALEYVVLTGRFTIYFEGDGYDNGEGGVEHDTYYPAGLSDRAPGPYPEAERRADVLRLYARQVTDLLAAGKKVILLYPVPEQGWDVPAFVAKTLFFSGQEIDLSVSHDSFKARNHSVIANFDAIPDHPNLFRVKPDAILCDTFIAGRCVGALDQKAFYYDDDHLSNYGASYIAPEIARHITPRPTLTAEALPERVAIPPQPLLEYRPQERGLVHDIAMETGTWFLD